MTDEDKTTSQLIDEVRQIDGEIRANVSKAKANGELWSAVELNRPLEAEKRRILDLIKRKNQLRGII